MCQLLLSLSTLLHFPLGFLDRGVEQKAVMISDNFMVGTSHAELVVAGWP